MNHNAKTARASALILAWLLAAVAGPLQALEPELVSAPDSVPLCVVEAGNPTGRPILFIHGLTQSHAVFKRQFESSLAKDYRLVAFDLRGHGCSGKPWERASYAASEVWANDIRAIIQQKKLERPVIVAWSFGALTVADYVRKYGTADLAAIVLTGSDGALLPVTDAAVREQRQKQRAANAKYPLSIEAGAESASRFVTLMGGEAKLGDIARLMDVSYQMLPVYARRVITSREVDNSDLGPRLKLPVLFFEGGADGAVQIAPLTLFATTLPDAKVLAIPGNGHTAFIESAERFNAELRELMERLAR